MPMAPWVKTHPVRHLLLRFKTIIATTTFFFGLKPGLQQTTRIFHPQPHVDSQVLVNQ